MSIHDKIKELRTAQGWTQEEMAEKMDISVSGYANLEKGLGKVDWDKLVQIAQIFKIDLVQLVEAEQKGLVVQQNISFGNETHDLNKNNDMACVFELEKKDLIIAHQKELLQQKDNEIQALKDLIEMYKKQMS